LGQDANESEDPIRSPLSVYGAHIPRLGFGTFELEGDDAQRMVEAVLEMGYRHVDTAQIYENEEGVGAGLKAAGVPRDEVWVTTKVWPDHFGEGEFHDSVQRSLDRLGLDSVDLLLLHWPSFEGTSLQATVKRLNQAWEKGWARHIGVSNFNTALLEQAWAATQEPLVVNQVEYHPFLDQTAVLAAVRDHGMALTAYSPVAQGGVTDAPELTEIARRHDKNEHQVALRWLLQQDSVVAIPRTSSEEHCRQNQEVYDFRLSKEEMETIFALARSDGRIISPEGLAPDWD
jgi:diketogulonate reductase-like aldo/keto reductase